MDEKQNSRGSDEINLVDYVIVILKHKEFVIKSTLAAMLVAVVISVFIPPTYMAETKILPPQSGGSSMSSLMASQMGVPAAVLGVKTTNDLYLNLIKTRGVADYVIDKFGLVTSANRVAREDARKKLSSGLSVSDDKKSGLLTLDFVHRDPQVAADIANAYVEGLQNLNNRLAVTEAGQRRLFFEEQLKNAKENLIKSEEALKAFQRRTGTLKIDDEVKAVLGTVAEMRAKVSSKEVQMRVMRSYATAENPDLQRLQDETTALKEELRKMESKNRIDDDSVSTVGKMSSLGTEYIRRMREFRYNEALYEILMKQFEAAKLDESKDAALVQVVEKAEAPVKRIKPVRRKIVANTGIFVFFSAMLFVLLKVYYQSLLQRPESKHAAEIIIELLDFTQLRKDFRIDMVLAKTKSLFRV